MRGTVLVVDDHAEYARFLTRLLSKYNYKIKSVYDGKSAREAMSQLYPDVVLMDKNLPDADGIVLVGELKTVFPETQFIIITGHGTIKSAVQSNRRGAMDYLTKPCEAEEILLAVDNAMNKKSMRDELKALRQTVSKSSVPASCFEGVQYNSDVMGFVMQLAKKAASQEGIIMLLGETGTGKERLAKWIHNNSIRAGGPFFSLKTSALPLEVAEAELFGHEPGAFADTRIRKKGLIELADKGTLLINEIESMDIALQSKLLRYLETKSIMRIGAEELTPVDTRIIVSSSKPFKLLVDSGEFLTDLYYRINVFPVNVPPLKSRKEDISILTKEILDTLKNDLGLSSKVDISPDALLILKDYDWPGNIRELRNVLERTLMLGCVDVIGPEDIPLSPLESAQWHYMVHFPTDKSLHEISKEVTRELIKEALKRGKTKQDAARLLGLSRHALAHQMKITDIK